MEDIILKSVSAKNYACKAHSDTNHTYDGLPYHIHLQMVFDYGVKYIDLISENDREDVMCSLWLHDTIEDCRITFNDLKKQFDELVAEIVYAVTNEKGKTREERANDKYYEGIRSTPYAVFIKLCDRLANVKYSKDTGSRMFEVYKTENEQFLQKLIIQPITFGFIEMVEELRNMFKDEKQ